MLMALLYCDDDRIAAAAPACDQMPYGDRYWDEIHGGEILHGAMFETAYVTVADAEMRQRLLNVGFDDSSNGTALAKELIDSLVPNYLPGRAA